MARLLPSTPDLSAAEESEPRVIGIDGDDADDLIAAMSSRTARDLLTALHDEPAAPSELADRVGTSLQNAQYHLANLVDAGVVEVIDTVYSEKGREMKIYAPSDRPLVVVAAGSDETANLRSTLTSVLGAVGALAVVSLFVHVALGGGIGLPFAATGGAGGSDGGVSAADVGTTAAPAPAAVDAAGLPPGLVFFAGGLAVILAGIAIRYWQRR